MYKITWDKETGGVLLNQKVAEEALAAAPRPVFHEELDMLRLNKMGWAYPHCDEPIMWAVNKQYYYRGELRFEVKGANIYDAPVVVPRVGVTPQELQAVDVKRMLERNSDIMFLIESEAIEFIRDTYLTYSKAKKAEDSAIDYEALALRAEKKTKTKMAIVKEDCESFDVMPLEAAQEQGKKIYHTTHVDMFIASFSGGKDSQVVLDLCTRAIPPAEFQVIYSDTGYELPSSLELYEQVKDYYHKVSPSLKFSLTKNHESVLNYWDKIGTPSDSHRWCCSVMKTAPLYRSLKIEGTNKQARVLAFDGVRAEESTRRSGYLRIGKGKHTTIYNAHPILYWNSVEIFMYLFRYKLPINKSYKQGKARVGCLICPFSTSWDEMISNRFYHEEMLPFINRLRKWAKLNAISDDDSYLKERNWKIKAIGEPSISNASVVFPYDPINFIADISNNNHPISSWLHALGEFSQISDEKEIRGEIKFNGIIYPYKITKSGEEGEKIRFVVNNCVDSKLIYLLRRIVNKSTYCIQCEVCEVDCPTGALTIYPQLKIDKTKCIHCHRCLTSHDMGCIAADSIRMIRDMDKKSTAKVHAYKKFGMRDEWIDEFFADPSEFWSFNTLGSAQVDGLKSWLKDAEIIDVKNQLTEFGMLLQGIYREDSIVAWELLLVNLVSNSYIVNWFVRTISTGTVYDKNVLNELISGIDTGASTTTNQNAITALMQLFSYSPIGSEMGFAIDVNNRQKMRKEYENISDIAVAYCLYKTTEKSGIHSLRVNDFYSEGGLIGPNIIFGISKPTFIKSLRQLSSLKEQVLIADLNMGLDSISLRNDLSALDVIKILTA